MVVRCLLCRTTHKSLLEPFIFCWGCLTAVGAAAVVDSGSPQELVVDDDGCFGVGAILMVLWQRRLVFVVVVCLAFGIMLCVW
jgi:hypothetical protein